MKARVVILYETSVTFEDSWKLCFQYCRYEFTDKSQQNGYRFIWRRPNTGYLVGAMGQSILPSLSIILKLLSQALAAGWANFDSGRIIVEELNKDIEVEDESNS